MTFGPIRAHRVGYRDRKGLVDVLCSIRLLAARRGIRKTLSTPADGLLVPPHQAYPLPPHPQPSKSCLMTALQMGYLTGRREVAYANTEACMMFRGSRGVVLPYGYHGPYVPADYFAPPGWVRPLW